MISCHGNAKSAKTKALFELLWLITKTNYPVNFVFEVFLFNWYYVHFDQFSQNSVHYVYVLEPQLMKI